MNRIEANLLATDLKFAVISTRWNHLIVDRLVEGAELAFVQHGGRTEHLDHYLVPGAYEVPLIARNLLQSLHLLSTTSDALRTKCVDGIEANIEGCERSAEGTLAVATALNPFIGYDKAADIVKDASKSGRTLREVAREHGVDEATLDKALDLRKIAAGSKAT